MACRTLNGKKQRRELPLSRRRVQDSQGAGAPAADGSPAVFRLPTGDVIRAWVDQGTGMLAIESAGSLPGHLLRLAHDDQGDVMSVYPDEKQARERVAEIKESHGIVPEVITFAGGFRLSFDPEDQPLPLARAAVQRDDHAGGRR